MRVILEACRGLAITPRQLFQELKVDGINELHSGELTTEGLRLTAETLAKMRCGNARLGQEEDTHLLQRLNNGEKTAWTRCAELMVDSKSAILVVPVVRVAHG